MGRSIRDTVNSRAAAHAEVALALDHLGLANAALPERDLGEVQRCLIGAARAVDVARHHVTALQFLPTGAVPSTREARLAHAMEFLSTASPTQCRILHYLCTHSEPHGTAGLMARALNREVSGTGNSNSVGNFLGKCIEAHLVWWKADPGPQLRVWFPTEELVELVRTGVLTATSFLGREFE